MPNPKNIGNGSKRPSISEALTASLGLHEYPSVFGSTGFSGNAGFGTIERKPKPETYLGRSYVGSFSNPGSLLAREGGVTTPDSVHLPLHREHTGRNSVHDGGNLHRQTAALNDYFGGYNGSVMELDHDVIEDGNYLNSGYSGKGGVLLPVSVIEGNNCQANTGEDVAEEEEALIDAFEDELEAVTRVQLSPITSRGSNHYGAIPVQPLYERSSVYESSEFHGLAGRVRKVGLQTVSYIPAVILGMLLNVLDALSYGMIIFPIAEPVFSHLGPTGLTMFYVSTIVSQVVYSSGFSTFNAGIGSQMVEVTPFFHTMAQSILGSLGESRSEEVISTTIVCYAMSSVLTGIAFMLLGKLRLGKIVGFFPRHILIGCIGGVAYFLIITGVEVTSRVPRFEYTWSFLGTLFADFEAFAKWALPAVMTAVLVVLQHWVEGSLLLPTYYLVSFMLFHFMVAAIPSISLHLLRDKGWIFQVVSIDERWYSFYKLYDFKLVQWRLVAKQIPTMLALTFFGVLHVPINVPALAILCGVDNLDVDKELLAHGYSNFLSGLMGSIQNYLVYTNSVLFIRAGADTKYAGILLAIGTAIFMIIGPVIISFIPICIVGSLMYLLGYELLKEVLYDTWGKVSNFEYITIVIIVLTMGIYDFVGGILVGILIAVISFLIDSTKLQTVNGEFTGKVAKSAVYRDYLQTKFLDKVGEQIYVMKLQNILFFGTIVSIEERIEKLFEVTEKDADKKMIKYLILDFKNIMADNIDYSAAEGFNRIKRLLESKRITLIISSISRHDRIYHAFNKVGLLESVELFGDLNSALEWCENEFLVRYKELFYRVHLNKTKRKDGAKSWDTFHLQQANTPRKTQVLTVAERVLSAEHQLNDLNAVYQSNQPVLPLLLLCLKRFRPKVLSNDKDEVKLWRQLCPYFKHTRIPASTPIANEGNIFFLLESGVVKIHYHFTQGTIYEAMSGRTCYGSIQDYNIQLPASSISTETACALWIIDSQSLQRLQEENLKLYTELLMVYLSITQYRFKELLSYSLISN